MFIFIPDERVFKQFFKKERDHGQVHLTFSHFSHRLLVRTSAYSGQNSFPRFKQAFWRPGSSGLSGQVVKKWDFLEISDAD